MEQNVISPPTLCLLWTKTADDISSPDSTSLSLSLRLQILSPSPFCKPSLTPLHPEFSSPSPFFVPHFNSVSPVSFQTSSPAALQPPRAPHQHLSPHCQRSACPRRWGSAHWGRFPCPKTSSTNRPWRRRRGRTCPTRPTPRGSGAVKLKYLRFPTTHQNKLLCCFLHSASIAGKISPVQVKYSTFYSTTFIKYLLATLHIQIFNKKYKSTNKSGYFYYGQSYAAVYKVAGISSTFTSCNMNDEHINASLIITLGRYIVVLLSHLPSL